MRAWTRGGLAGIGLGALLMLISGAEGGPPPGEGDAAETAPWRTLDQEVELGLVRWERDYAAGRARATREGKPLFVLFQEVPG